MGTLESYAYLGLGTVVRRAHPQIGVDLTYIRIFEGYPRLLTRGTSEKLAVMATDPHAFVRFNIMPKFRCKKRTAAVLVKQENYRREFVAIALRPMGRRRSKLQPWPR